MWKLAFTLGPFVGMHEMWMFAMKRAQLRVMLRAFSCGFQHAMLCHIHESVEWRAYWKHWFKTVWRSVPEQSSMLERPTLFVILLADLVSLLDSKNML